MFTLHFFCIVENEKSNASNDELQYNRVRQLYCVVTLHSLHSECESHWKCHRLTLPQLICEREIHAHMHATHTHVRVRVHIIFVVSQLRQHQNVSVSMLC